MLACARLQHKPSERGELPGEVVTRGQSPLRRPFPICRSSGCCALPAPHRPTVVATTSALPSPCRSLRLHSSTQSRQCVCSWMRLQPTTSRGRSTASRRRTSGASVLLGGGGGWAWDAPCGREPGVLGSAGAFALMHHRPARLPACPTARLLPAPAVGLSHTAAPRRSSPFHCCPARRGVGKRTRPAHAGGRPVTPVHAPNAPCRAVDVGGLDPSLYFGFPKDLCEPRQSVQPCMGFVTAFCCSRG